MQLTLQQQGEYMKSIILGILTILTIQGAYAGSPKECVTKIKEMRVLNKALRIEFKNQRPVCKATPSTPACNSATDYALLAERNVTAAQTALTNACTPGTTTGGGGE